MENKELIEAVKAVSGAIHYYGESLDPKVGNIEFNTMNVESKLDDIINLLKSIEKKL